MRLTASLPSKCFVIGEYLVLDSGRAILVNTSPRFEMHMDTRGTGACVGIHPESPAGRFARQENAKFQNVNLAFQDPHGGRGGLGASSAQFIATFIFRKILESKDPKIASPDFSAELLKSYKAYVEAKEGRTPSGADVLSQFWGGFVNVDLNLASATELDWNFPEHGFFLVRTGAKVATHEHLAQLRQDSFAELSKDFTKANEAIASANAKDFALALQGYQNTLEDMGLLAPFSAGLLSDLKQTKLFTGLKACGAMGADILFLMYPIAMKTAVKDLLKEKGLAIVGSEAELTDGLTIQAVPNRAITKGPWLE